jgi:hypothetical protein
MAEVMALFQDPHDVEAVVAELSLNGFTEKDVSVVIFSALPPPRGSKPGLVGWLSRGGFLGDTIDRSDGISLMDGVGVGAVIGCLLGVIFGGQWRYGPIATGTAGLLYGGLVGWLMDIVVPEKRRDQAETALIRGMVLVSVRALQAARAEDARRLLEGNHAKQVAVLPVSDSALSR